MKKVLFIDRDGVLIVEPPVDRQLDSFEKLAFYPKVFQYLSRIAKELDFELVMVTNQDGLGTDSFPESAFWGPHNLLVNTLAGEGIAFRDILIDRTFESDHAHTRKPGVGMLTEYMNSMAYDMSASIVVGDRLTDIQLAKNLGAKGIFMGKNTGQFEEKGLTDTCILATEDWGDIYRFLKLAARSARVQRATKETDVFVDLLLDGTGKADNHTGLCFFDHMLDQLARHSGCDLAVRVQGDLHIDEHHTIEDAAIALGEAFYEALGNKLGIERYGYCLPMDDCLAQVAIDFGGRSWLVWDAVFNREKIGDMPAEMFFHFFKSFSDAARCNLNIKAEGVNEHHKIEAIFKAFAKSIKMAVRRDENNMRLPTTKGVL